MCKFRKYKFINIFNDFKIADPNKKIMHVIDCLKLPETVVSFSVVISFGVSGFIVGLSIK